MNKKQASNPSNKSGNAGGFFIAFGAVAGVLIGGILGEPSFGLLSGLGLGALIALAIWLKER